MALRCSRQEQLRGRGPCPTPATKCYEVLDYLASNLNRARFRLYAGKPCRTRGGNKKLCIFPRSRLTFTPKAGSKPGDV